MDEQTMTTVRLREPLKRLAGGRPIGMNALIEASSSTYRARMERWIDVALEEGVRFILTSLGNPRWVVDRAHAVAESIRRGLI